MQFLRRSLTGLFLLSVTLGLLALAGNSFYGALQERWSRESTPRPARERVLAVTTVLFEPQVIAPTLTAFGEVRSRRTLEIRTGVAGRVVALAEAFDEGALVEAGTLLAQIDPTDARSAVSVATADVAEAEAELRDADRSLALAKDELNAAQAQADLRAQALTRQQDLRDRGVGTEAAVETAALSEASARQAVLTRRIALASAEGRVDQANTRLQRVAIALADAERQLAETRITAAFDGALADVAVVEGGLVSTNERLATLIDTEALEVAFRLSNAQYTRLLDERGSLIQAPVTIRLDVLGLDLEATGQVSRVSAEVGEGQTGRQVFARLDTAAGIRPGDFVTVLIEEPPLADLARLPATALDAQNRVLVIGDEDRLVQEPVELVRRQGDDVLVRAAVLAGKRLVAEQTPLLGPGIRVRDTSATPPEGRDVAAAGAQGGQGGGERITLTPERRDRLIAAVEANTRMPTEAKERILSQLKQDTVPARMVERIESRMGG